MRMADSVLTSIISYLSKWINKRCQFYSTTHARCSHIVTEIVWSWICEGEFVFQHERSWRKRKRNARRRTTGDVGSTLPSVAPREIFQIFTCREAQKKGTANHRRYPTHCEGSFGRFSTRAEQLFLPQTILELQTLVIIIIMCIAVYWRMFHCVGIVVCVWPLYSYL